MNTPEEMEGRMADIAGLLEDVQTENGKLASSIRLEMICPDAFEHGTCSIRWASRRRPTKKRRWPQNQVLQEDLRGTVVRGDGSERVLPDNAAVFLKVLPESLTRKN